ncbi:MAG: hypothetical protein HRS57_01970 [Mycoplasmataceae bacterium]|nr:hypothetical protein [Mycoplasmataceae bacterium]
MSDNDKILKVKWKPIGDIIVEKSGNSFTTLERKKSLFNASFSYSSLNSILNEKKTNYHHNISKKNVFDDLNLNSTNSEEFKAPLKNSTSAMQDFEKGINKMMSNAKKPSDRIAREDITDNMDLTGRETKDFKAPLKNSTSAMQDFEKGINKMMSNAKKPSDRIAREDITDNMDLTGQAKSNIKKPLKANRGISSALNKRLDESLSSSNVGNKTLHRKKGNLDKTFEINENTNTKLRRSISRGSFSSTEIDKMMRYDRDKENINPKSNRAKLMFWG